MCEANATWGAPRIHGELLKLGIDVSEATVSKYLARPRKPPSQTWRTFLDNHVRNLVSVDFFTVPTVFFQVLFVFVILAHDRRRILSIIVTSSPSATWTANQIVQAFPWETVPRYLLRDRDGIYGADFRGCCARTWPTTTTRAGRICLSAKTAPTRDPSRRQSSET